MAGNKPDFKFVVKSKNSGEFIDVAAFWDGDKGISGQFDNRNIESIKLKDGRVILPDQVYCNLQKQRNEQDQQLPSDANEHNQTPPTDDVPF